MRLAALAGFVLAASFAHADGIAWSTDYDKALAQARESGKIVHLHFWAEWCGPCKTMEATTLASPDVVSYLNDNFINVKIDIDKAEALASRLQVHAIPATVLLDGAGAELLRFTGDRPDFLAHLRNLREISEAEKALAANPSDPATLIRVATVYANAERFHEAADLFMKIEEIDPEDKSGLKAEAWYRVGLVHLKDGHKSDSDTAWNRYVQLDPDNKKGFHDDLQFALIEVESENQNYAKVLESVKQFLDRYPESERIADARFLMGTARFFTGDIDGAIQSWKEVIDRHADTDAAKKAKQSLAYAEKKQKKTTK